MNKNSISALLSENDIRGERLIAVLQAFMAMVILMLHLIAASKTNWETLEEATLFVVAGIVTASLFRISATRNGNLPRVLLHGLTVVDGALLFALIYSYNIAYDLPAAATFKAPSIVLFVVFICVRVVKFEPSTILVSAATVLLGWFLMHLVAIKEGASIVTSYPEYLNSFSILPGASIELAIGFFCAALALAYAMYLARGFVAKTALIEDLENANRAMEQHANEFENLFASSVEGILMVDRKGNILRANSALANMFGYEESELIGKNAAVLMSDQNADLLRAGIEQYLNAGESDLVGKRFETDGRKSTGNYFPIELSICDFTLSGETCFAGFIQDISSRKLSESNEMDARAQFESAVNAAMDAIIIIDEDGYIAGFNPAAEQTFGYLYDEVVGKRLSDTIIPERYRQAHDQGMQHYLKTGEAPVLNSRIEIESKHASGEEILIELAIREIETGGKKMFFGYARDIRERKKAEENLLLAKEEAEVASLAKARFFAMMSHEIRTPLNGILGIVNLLDGTSLNKNQREMLETARVSGHSLLTVINDILDFSKIEAGKFKIELSPFDCAALINSVANLFAPQAEKKGVELRFHTELSAQNIFVGDSDRIRQILVNLIGNAIKFTDSGRIEISVHESEGHGLRFDVTDTGAGIDETKIGKLFNEFSTLDEHRTSKTQGTGLGLVICKSLVEAMNGSIGVSSKIGIGSHFWFELPLEKTKQKLPKDRNYFPQMEAFDRLHEKRILVAEDNVTNQLIVREYLTRAGCLVDIASNGLEAVELFKKGNYDVVLMDISMPEIDGYEASKRIKALGEQASVVPIIAFSAYADTEEQDNLGDTNMIDYIPKPFTEKQLLGTLMRCLCAEDLLARQGNTEDKLSCDISFDSKIVTSLFGELDDESTKILVSQFARDLHSFERQASDAISNEDWEVIEKVSHRLKSSSGMFGAMKLCKLSEQVNQFCLKGEIDENLTMAVDMMKETHRVLQQVESVDADGYPKFLLMAMEGQV